MLSAKDALDKEAARYRSDVESKSHRLVLSEAQNHQLGLQLMRLLRRREGVMAENIVARDILELQRATEEHLQAIATNCIALDTDVDKATSDCAVRMDSLKEEWIRRRNEYQRDMDDVEDRLEIC